MTAILSPYDNSVVGHAPDHSEADVRAAITRAAAQQAHMSAMPAHQRGTILNTAATIIRDNLAPLATLMAQESGKPMRYARAEVTRAAETFVFAADEARRLHGETIPLDAAVGGVGRMGYYVRVPIGVIAAITPFNFPLNLVSHKVAPAIAAGCPIVLKPAPQTPLTALRLAEIMREAGLPEGAFEVVTGGVDVGRWLMTDPRIAMITFTGSVPVARQIAQAAGIRRVTLELGGNAATIIDEDANLAPAIARTVMGSFAYSGQVCISVQRLYVHRRRYDEFRAHFIAATQKLVMGDPLDDATEIGPMISDAAAARTRAWITEAVRDGATLVYDGGQDGRMVGPLVLENVGPQMKVMCEEAFAPLVNLIPFHDFEEALAAVNDSEFGLQAGVYTSNLNHTLRAVQALEVGGVIINDVPTFRVDNMPYGGMKASGIGREGPRFAVEDMTHLKMVVMQMS
jgi:acyl-CoA reductase-like NAD-dependent aldehyde dehydrogenase